MIFLLPHPRPVWNSSFEVRPSHVIFHFVNIIVHALECSKLGAVKKP